MRNVRDFAVRLLAVGALAFLGSACASSVVPFEEGNARYRFSIRLSRGIGETGACAASVSVSDLAARKKIAIPLFTAPWGEKSEGEVVDSLYGVRLTASVTMSADGTAGQCRAVLLRGSDLIASRTTSVPVVVAKSPPKLKFP